VRAEMSVSASKLATSLRYISESLITNISFFVLFTTFRSAKS
jgi:hypothetical protein